MDASISAEIVDEKPPTSPEILSPFVALAPCIWSSDSDSQQFESDEEGEDEYSPAEEDNLHDPYKELQAICTSSKFSISGRETRPSKSKRTKRKRRNKFVINSYSVHHTDEYTEDSSIEDELDEEAEEDYLAEQSPEFLKAWEEYWTETAEQTLWASWTEKYKDYINPAFDMVDRIKNMPLYSESSSEDEGPEEIKNVKEIKVIDFFKDGAVRDHDGGSQAIKQLGKRKSDGKKELPVESSNNEQEQKWNGAWEDHCQAVYVEEYNKFSKKHAKMSQKNKDNPQHNPRLRKYWAQRYELFSKYDEGIKLDHESWFSVTPENIAVHIANRCKTDGVILDAFCGCGGNTIQFAKTCGKVIAVDIDPIKIEYCRHNARIYGVEDKIEFIVGDFMEIAPTLKADVVFLSPPWGGPAYQCTDVFDIENIPMGGFKLMEVAQTISKNIAYFLPRNVDKQQVGKCAGEGNFVEIERNLHLDKVKTITAYYGSLLRKKIKKICK